MRWRRRLLRRRRQTRIVVKKSGAIYKVFYRHGEIEARDCKWGWFFECSRCKEMDPEPDEKCWVKQKV